ncbi:DinB family protein [Flavobacterium sp. ANB]|uniref:DinB family protein n=1 Tax=unclassified Flavobacterium TaxID=196869 RepID=UPI0012B8A4CF|nr:MULTISPECIES: DinB family protein [unclassified Flavobacterium]MBF4515923.1 DinB family protein [Flavobacterium sp. ANB]MTD68925.1 DinB family protein [Flavobacterium sp. LC2016-13]
MQNAIFKFEKLLNDNVNYFSTLKNEVLEAKVPGKWSKKEILGHLIDSAIHNLVRFTEINYVEKPYQHRPYNQIDLVNLNEYQKMDITELTTLWFSINKQIVRIMKSVDKEALDYKILLSDQSVMDLRFLMIDYVEHLEHHINQIKS